MCKVVISDRVGIWIGIGIGIGIGIRIGIWSRIGIRIRVWVRWGEVGLRSGSECFPYVRTSGRYMFFVVTLSYLATEM